MFISKMKNYLKSVNLSNNKLKLIFFLFLNLILSINSESVCDHELLIMELKQDLEDNGILDCLRYLEYLTKSN